MDNLLGTSLPVGGESTHTVLTAHSGMANQKMFSDLDLMEKGDVFYLEILDEILAYQVDAIHVVLPHDTTHLGKEIVVGENVNTIGDERYMCAYCDRNEIFGLYSDLWCSDDFCEVVKKYAERLSEQAEKTRRELRTPILQGIDITPVLKAECTPISSKDDLNGKIVVIKQDVLRQEYRRSTNQIKLCTGGFGASPNVYDDLKKKLVAKGIPPEEIAFIHEANTEVRKKELFARVRSGQVRVLIGSTAKMGAGTNVQDRLIALHDLDCPWRPSDLAQRLGRIVRQGNQNPEVEIFRYVTENTFDAYLYQLVENKQKFIAQIMTSKAPARIADDVDETALSYSEIKALATGNPLIIEKCNLDVEVSKLNMLKANHLNQRFSLENMVYRRYPAKIAELKEQIAGYEKDVATAQAHPKSAENFVGMEIYGTQHTEKEAAGRAIISACKDLQGSEPVQLGQYRGFSISLQYISDQTDYKLTIKGAMSHTIILGADIYGNITRMDNMIDRLSEELEDYRAVLQDTQTQLANAKAEMETPFAREKELAEKSARLKELNILLNMDQKDRSVLDEGPEADAPEKEKRREQER